MEYVVSDMHWFSWAGQDWIHILSDPDPAELERMMRIGQLVTWPKVLDIPFVLTIV